MIQDRSKLTQNVSLIHVHVQKECWGNESLRDIIQTLDRCINFNRILVHC
jgi:hypothetical protein